MSMPGVGPEVARRPLLASYDNYLDAQAAVDKLSDSGFPVQHLSIVGTDLKLVETVLGRLSWGRAAVSGLGMGIWFGLLAGLLISLFAAGDGSPLTIVLLGMLYGAAFGIVFGLISYAFTGGKRDFISRQSLQAARYEVLCDSEVLDRAKETLGSGA